jgi:lipid II:glycine glycyltransferase (peptidoglycan interpeptide bridge formation enzyme)
MFLDGAGCEAERDAAQAAFFCISQLCDAVEVTPWPLGKIHDLAVNARRTHGEVSVIDLGQGPDAALARIDGKARRMAGQAERRGVTCARADGPAALQTYYEMLEASARRWGLQQPTISKDLLRDVFAHAGRDAEIWFAYYEGKAIAGGAVLFGSQEMYFWSAAMYGEFSTLRPSNALNVMLIKYACDRGMRWYNLSSSSGLTGVERFKDSLGAQRVRYTTYRSERGPYAVYSAVRSALLRVRQR